MKKIIILAFALLPILSFAQEKQKISKLPPSSQNISQYENSIPSYFVDGEIVDKSILLKIDTATIDKINIVKNDQNYKHGKIMITLKSKKS